MVQFHNVQAITKRVGELTLNRKNILSPLLAEEASRWKSSPWKGLRMMMQRRYRGLLSQVMVRFVLVCIFGAVALLWPRPGVVLGSPAKLDPDLLHELSDSFQSLTRKVSPAVVQIQVTSYGPVRGGDEESASLIGMQHVTGSGVIVDPEGYIITNAHVVAGAQRVRVILSPVFTPCGAQVVHADSGCNNRRPGQKYGPRAFENRRHRTSQSTPG